MAKIEKLDDSINRRIKDTTGRMTQLDDTKLTFIKLEPLLSYINKDLKNVLPFNESYYMKIDNENNNLILFISRINEENQLYLHNYLTHDNFRKKFSGIIEDFLHKIDDNIIKVNIECVFTINANENIAYGPITVKLIRDESKENPLELLPPELIDEISLHLEIKDSLKLFNVNKKMHECINNKFWFNFTKKIWKINYENVKIGSYNFLSIYKVIRKNYIYKVSHKFHDKLISNINDYTTADIAEDILNFIVYEHIVDLTSISVINTVINFNLIDLYECIVIYIHKKCECCHNTKNNILSKLFMLLFCEGYNLCYIKILLEKTNLNPLIVLTTEHYKEIKGSNYMLYFEYFLTLRFPTYEWVNLFLKVPNKFPNEVKLLLWQNFNQSLDITDLETLLQKLKYSINNLNHHSLLTKIFNHPLLQEKYL